MSSGYSLAFYFRLTVNQITGDSTPFYRWSGWLSTQLPVVRVTVNPITGGQGITAGPRDKIPSWLSTLLPVVRLTVNPITGGQGDCQPDYRWSVDCQPNYS